MKGRFDGVRITDAAGGLGHGAAKGFATQGARLMLSDIDERQRHLELAAWEPVAPLSVFVQRI
ncbi:MAG: hypothetical protein E5Y31_01150 [Mesorhizobium sp.]|nr:MAG: hypothetical protein E5Y31_01150 [Mesorhizobium sp.]